MTIGEIINHYGEEYTPYVGGLVNHLPMGQLAVYRMTKDLEKVKSFTRSFLERVHIGKVQDHYPRIDTVEETLGNRNLYEPCLDLVRKELEENGMDEYVNHVLNKYTLGLSSGLFHTTIRVAYAMEGVRLDPILVDEVERALAYYITAYRKSELFTRRIPGSSIIQEMNQLANDDHIKSILKNQNSLGMKIRALYDEKDFMDRGFIIEGSGEKKIEALLDLLIPAYYFSGNIVILHCITGLHGIIVLKDYFEDYSRTLDILTTSIIVHLLTTGYHYYHEAINDFTHVSWDAIISVGSEKCDVHAVKLAYSCNELYKLYPKPGLKEIALKRINYN